MSSPDWIFVRDLEISACIGAYEWERRIRQTIILDLEMSADIRQSAASDDLADTLDYWAVVKRVVDFVEHRNCQLVETLAEEIAALIMKEFGVTHIKLSVNKPGAVRGTSGVGVRIERSV